MSTTELSGLAHTVLGPVRPEDLGPTTTHEHLLIDFTCMFKPPTEATEKLKAYQPLTLENLGWVRYNPFRNEDNLLLGDEDTAISEALLFKKAGGKTIVDATTIGIGRDPLALARIARATGLNIIMGAGYYVDMVHPADMDDKTEDEIAREIVAEITVGVGNTGVRAGIIGELGCTWPLTDNERKVLRAAAQAQRETGCPVLIHPGRNEAAPLEILDVLARAGADISRVIMSHMDRTMPDVAGLIELARTGCLLEWDGFGIEVSYYPLSDMDFPSDAQKLDFIKAAVDQGYVDQIVIGEDMYSKHRLVRYGGHGYGYILENIVPRMREKGLSDEDIQAIIVKNPARVLTFV